MTSSEDDPDEFVVGAKYAYVLDRAGAKVHLEYIEYAQPNLARLGEWLYWTKWYGYPDNENTLQLESDMSHSSNIINSFWHDVGEEKRDLTQYSSEELTTLRLLSSLTWRKRCSTQARRVDEAEHGKKGTESRGKGKAPAQPQRSTRDKIAAPRKTTPSAPSSSRTKQKSPASASQKTGSKVTMKATVPTAESSKRRKSSETPRVPKQRTASASGSYAPTSSRSSSMKPPSSRASQSTLVAADSSAAPRTPEAPVLAPAPQLEPSRTTSLLPGWKPLPSLLDATQEASRKRKTRPSDTSADELPIPKHPRRNPRLIESDPEEEGGNDENQSEASSGDDPLFHDMPSPASTSPKTAPPRSRSSSPDEPLAKTTSPKDGAADVAGSASSAATVVHLDTATKAYSRPIQPVVDKHRQSKVRFRPLETKPKHYGLPLRTTQPSSSSKDRASPVTPVASVRPSTSRGASSSSSAAAALSPRQTDQSLPFAHSMSPPLDLGPTSPTTLASPTALASPTGPASSVTNIPTTTATDNNNSTKSRRKSAMDVTDFMEKVVKTEMPQPKPKSISSVQVAKKWSGGLYLNDTERPLCNVYYERKSSSSDLGRAMNSMDKLVAVKQLPEMIFLSLFCPAFEPPQEFGTLTAVDIPDRRNFDKFVAYMEWNQHVAVIPLGKTESAYFVLYPSSLTNITVSLNIAIPHSAKPSMILLMLQKAIPRPFPDITSSPAYPSHWSDDLRRLVGDHPQYQRAARYFAIDPELLAVLQQCPFSVFNNHSRYHHLDHRTNNPGLPGVDPSEDIETRELVALLTRKRDLEPDDLMAKRFDWRTERPAPVMFIHANAWLQETGEIPAFMHMRDSRTRFFKFGTVAGTESLWGTDYRLHEVFTIGTVLSFTADALIADMPKAINIMSMVADDPTSQVYFHPDMLGVLERIALEDSGNRGMARLAVRHIKNQLKMHTPPFCITYCPPPNAIRIADKSGSADVLAEEEIRLARLKYHTDQLVYSHKYVDSPDVLFQRFREGLTGTYAATATDATLNASPLQPTPPSSPAAPTVVAKTAPPDTVIPIPLDTLERRVAETCASDLARMQALPTMYKQYRNFVLIYGERGRDEPKNLRPNEIKLSSIASFEWNSPTLPLSPPESPPWEI